MKKEFLRYRLAVLAEMIANNDLSDENREALLKIQTEVEEQLNIFTKAESPTAS